jgi:organic radical activating enzyme
MTSIRESIKRLFGPVRILPPGIYHYQAPPEDPRNYRLHLRLETDGTGILILNAATVLHLNPSAAEYAFYVVNGTPEDQVIQEVSSRYRVSRSQALQDYRDFVDRIDALVTTPDLDPDTFLDFERQAPYSGHISAPYRLDCALTYRLPETSDAEVAPTKRVTRELSTAEWQTILDKAWQAGIPHIIFTGGEPTLREDLVPLIARGEQNGQVTGLLTNGLRLDDEEYLDELLQTGLDHVMIILDPAQDNAWTAIEKTASQDIFTAIHLTITPANKSEIPDLLDRLAELEVNGISLSAPPGLKEEVQEARQRVARLDLSLIWDLPVPYSSLNPVALELENEALPAGAGRAWLYVEPDGDVLPSQGINEVLGNFLTDSWEAIWKS